MFPFHWEGDSVFLQVNSRLSRVHIFLSVADEALQSFLDELKTALVQK